VHLFDEFEELRLGRGGVAHEEHVDVAAQAHPVGQHLAAAAHQLARDRLLDVVRVLAYM
jgi:hypothetical protein